MIEGAPAVETLPDIRALSHIDQPGRTEYHFLSAAAECEARIPTHRCLKVGKSLLQINLIDIGPRRQASRCHVVVAELDECSKGVVDMQVAREQQAMHIVGRGPPGSQAEERGGEVLDALAVLAAEIDVASRSKVVERNEFERRPEVVRPIGTVLVAWNILVD